MLKVLATDNLSQEGLKALKNHPTINLDVVPPLEPEKLKQEIGAYQAIVVRSSTKLSAEVLSCAKNLELIIRAGVGVDNIDVTYATEQGILVANTPKGNATTAAEHTFALLTALMRHVPQACYSLLKEKKWNRKQYVGNELYGKTIGIVGLGNIGTIVARIANGYGMHVVGCDPFVSTEYAKQLSIEKLTFDELIARADIITLHTPLTDQTRYLINENTIERMKPGALIVNCSRGGVVDEKALVLGLQSGRVGGAAIDVFEQEPPPPDHPLLAMDNVIATPHLGASTKEAQEGVSVDACELLIEYEKHQTVSSAINSTIRLNDLSVKQKAFFDLSDRLGKFLGQLMAGVPTCLAIEIHGEALEKHQDALLTQATKSFLGTMVSEEKVNIVNAKLLAQRRNIDLVTSHVASSNGGPYKQLIKLAVTVNGESDREEIIEIAGTVFDPNSLRLIEMNGYDFDVLPEGNMLFVLNSDTPGVVGKIASELGKSKINISRMSVSLCSQEKVALAIYTLDNPVSLELLDTLSGYDEVLLCKTIVI